VTIKWEGDQNFLVKTKQVTASIGSKIKLGDLDIFSPGEYEVGGVQVEVIDGVIEVLAEGMSIVHMKKAKVLSDEALEKINGSDILIIGVGGGDFTETKTALQVISQIEPAIVIPMHKGNLEEFAKEEGVSAKEGIEELKISRGDLPTDESKVVVLNALQ